jgi:menaquinol-cytochrome c reductase iron-sulfur subunit
VADEPETGATRRRFLRNVIAGVSGVIAATIGVPVAGYFFSPERRKKTNITIPVTRVSDIPIGRPTFVRYEQRVTDAWIVSTESKGAWVVTLDGKQFNVYDPHCTHLGCPYYWDQRRQIFQCPCHGGEYSINGEVLAGPPPRPLDRLAYTIEGGEIVLTGHILRGETSLP